MHIDLETAQPTMQEVVDLLALLSTAMVHAITIDTEAADAILSKVSTELDAERREEPEARLKAMIAGLERQLGNLYADEIRTGKRRFGEESGNA